MEEHELDLLQLARLERDTGTIAFLYRERHGDLGLNRDQIGGALALLQSKGWLEVSVDRGLWRLTPTGDEALRAAGDWRFVVEEVVQHPQHPYPIVTGRVRAGLLRRGDTFVVSDRDGVDQLDGTGQLASVQPLDEVGEPGRVALVVTNVVPRTGDVLAHSDPPPR